MTVYVAGRSTRTKGGATTERNTEDDDLTVERTAEEISALPGPGAGVAVPTDVASEPSVRALVDRIRSERGGRLDAVVCSAFQTPPGLTGPSDFRDDFWKQGADMWDACHGAGLRGSYLTCCEAAPLMIDTARQQKERVDHGRPLVVVVSSFGGKSYTFNVAYGVGKAGSDRLAADMAVQLAPHGVDAVALYPGVVRTEGNVEMDRRGEWAEASGGLDLRTPGLSESPRFSGRAVATLLAEGGTDPTAAQARSGQVVVAAELADDKGYTDVDGTTPPSIRNLRFLLPSFVFPQIEKESQGKATVPAWIKENIPNVLLPWSLFASGPPPTAD